MKISTLIALQTGTLVAVSLGLAAVVSDLHGTALEGRNKAARYSVECERFERVAELTSQLTLVGDLVLSGQTTYLSEVARRAANLACESIEDSISQDFLASAGVQSTSLTGLIRSLEGKVIEGGELGGQDREARLQELFDQFDATSIELEDGIEGARGNLGESVERAAAMAERSNSIAQLGTALQVVALLAVMLMVLRILRRTIQRPIARLTSAAEEAAASGRFDVIESGPFEVQELSRRFGDLYEGMSRALATRAAFLANTSHELRTPLNAILGYADFLSDGKSTDEELREGLGSIHSSGAHLLALINDVLDFSKIDADQMAICRVSTDLREQLDQVRAILTGGADESRVDLIVELDSDCPRLLMLDPVRFRQVVLNVAGNALKFTAKGFVRIQVSWSESRLRVVVRDTGIGIAPERVEGIFEDFQQADESSTRLYGGTGLGLAISRRLARLMGGDISVTSELGQGSEFAIEIEAGVAVGRLPCPLPSERPAATDRCLRVLLADDVVINQRLGTRILERAGHTVVVASDGVEVLEAFDTHGIEHFDVVLMDLQMPRISGLEATRELRVRGFGGPIVALTAAALSEQREGALAAGCSDFITKPFVASSLLEKLQSTNSAPSDLSPPCG
jgi:signal transduction histidine kinase/ActR/RegA family two-component response regulator